MSDPFTKIVLFLIFIADLSNCQYTTFENFRQAREIKISAKKAGKSLFPLLFFSARRRFSGSPEDEAGAE
ncbi:MAG: hypothetical protein J5789_01595, partial [Oscillospiraceae bacterium]|nr:hypothetical protein [Oscillospiraceae bacterium]